jgi:hypothetical protein
MNFTKITISNSFLELQQIEDAYSRSLCYSDRIRLTVEVIKQVYKKELLENKKTRKINFIKKG